MVASPAVMAATCSRRRARIKKTPASRRTRVRCREWRWVFLGEAKPASVMPRARVGGRFVLLDVEMTRLACFRRKCLLGRNLITLFQCVNSFAKIFSPAPAPDSRRRGIAALRFDARETGRTAQHPPTLSKNTAFNALFSAAPVPRDSNRTCGHCLERAPVEPSLTNKQSRLAGSSGLLF